MYNSIAESIGNTPTYRLHSMFKQSEPSVFLKMEQFNPGGSIKDRTALGLIQYEERRGTLKPQMTMIESSSGNTAIGLAILAKSKNYKVIAVCDRHLPIVKKTRLRIFGTDIVFLPDTPIGVETVELRIAVANYLAKNIPNSINLGQYSNPGNPEIHYNTTGPEIWQDMKGKINAVVIAVGTCGTISGVGRYLKEQDKNIMVIGVEPEGSVIFGGKPGTSFVQGGGLSFRPSMLDQSVVDKGIRIKDANTFGCLREVALKEGWMLGGSGGLVLAGLKEIAASFGPEDNIVGIIPDGGERYMETLYNDLWMVDNGFSDSVYEGKVSDKIAEDVIRHIGCSINEIPKGKGTSLEKLCHLIDFELT